MGEKGGKMRFLPAEGLLLWKKRVKEFGQRDFFFIFVPSIAVPSPSTQVIWGEKSLGTRSVFSWAILGPGLTFFSYNSPARQCWFF